MILIAHILSLFFTLRIVAAIQPLDAARKILDCFGLPSGASPLAAAAPKSPAEYEAF
jgi:hypothetical protein